MVARRPKLKYLRNSVAMAFGQDIDPLQAILNKFTFLAELKTNVLLQRGAGAASFIRATTAANSPIGPVMIAQSALANYELQILTR